MGKSHFNHVCVTNPDSLSCFNHAASCKNFILFSLSLRYICCDNATFHGTALLCLPFPQNLFPSRMIGKTLNHICSISCTSDPLPFVSLSYLPAATFSKMMPPPNTSFSLRPFQHPEQLSSSWCLDHSSSSSSTHLFFWGNHSMQPQEMQHFLLCISSIRTRNVVSSTLGKSNWILFSFFIPVQLERIALGILCSVELNIALNTKSNRNNQ